MGVKPKGIHLLFSTIIPKPYEFMVFAFRIRHYVPSRHGGAIFRANDTKRMVWDGTEQRWYVDDL